MVIKKSPFILIQQMMIGMFFVVIAILSLTTLEHFLSSKFALTHWQALVLNALTLLIPALAGLILFVYSLLKLRVETYVLRNDVIITNYGIFTKHQTTQQINSLRVISSYQNFLGKLFNYGNLHFRAPYGKEHVIIKSVDNFSETIIKLKKHISGNTSNKLLKLSFTKILQQDEDDEIEFKSSLRWDYKQNKVNKELEKTVMKTITGFMNYSGGVLVIGVDDEKSILGLERDIKTLRKKNIDGFANHFTQIFNGYIGAEYRQLVKLKLQRYKNKEVCLAYVSRSKVPVYLDWDGDSQLYVRTGNSTTLMNVKEANNYIGLHWGKH